MEEISRLLAERKGEIRARLEGFRAAWMEGDERVFQELCFCLMTPQSKALMADKVLSKLVETKLLYSGNEKDMKRHMNFIRFHHTKAKWIVRAREQFTDKGRIAVKSIIEGESAAEKREWLVKNVKGLGYKESSHFLRNVGFGDEIAILDRHILRNLARLGVIGSVPKSLGRKAYLDIEEKLKQFCKRESIGPAELDMALWCKETGIIFK